MSASPARLSLASVFIGNIGNMLEWYDFVVFAFLAPVIGARFFPAEDSLSALIQAFAVFGASILVAVGFYTLFTWMPTYLAHIVQPPVARAGLISTAATILVGLAIPLAGWTADRVGYRRVLLGADLL